MPDDIEVTKTTAPEATPSPDPAKAAPAVQPGNTGEGMISRAAFNRAMARVTAEKWDLSNQLMAERNKNAAARPVATQPVQPAQEKPSEDEEYDQLLGSGRVRAQESPAAPAANDDRDARLDGVEHELRLQRAANQLAILQEQYPEVDTQKVLDALQRDGRNEEFLGLYFEAERGRNADAIAAHQVAAAAQVQQSVAAASTEGPSQAAEKAPSWLTEKDPEKAMQMYHAERNANRTT